MDHVAIMRKNWGLLPKILSGEKKIESRWYKSKYAPWGKIKKGDRVFFKDSGYPVTVKAKVKKIIQFENLTKAKVKEILQKYGKADGIEKKDLANYYQMFKDKNYCLLIFIEKVTKVKSFEISKKGFGAMAAWITIPHINSIIN